MMPERKIPTAAVETPEVRAELEAFHKEVERRRAVLAPLLPTVYPREARESFAQDQGNGLSFTVYGAAPPPKPAEETPQEAARRLLDMIRKRVGRKTYDAEVDRLATKSPEFRAAVLALVEGVPSLPRPRRDPKALAAYQRAVRRGKAR